MEAHKGLKSILLDVLGLPVPPAAAQTQGQDPATPALVTDDAAAHAAAHAAAQHSDAGQQQGTEQTATTADAPAALGGAKTAKDDAFAARLSSISHQVRPPRVGQQLAVLADRSAAKGQLSPMI
jgi:hypothetical protein